MDRQELSLKAINDKVYAFRNPQNLEIKNKIFLHTAFLTNRDFFIFHSPPSKGGKSKPFTRKITRFLKISNHHVVEKRKRKEKVRTMLTEKMKSMFGEISRPLQPCFPGVILLHLRIRE